jgi:predicted Zn-dependent peptidase
MKLAAPLLGLVAIAAATRAEANLPRESTPGWKVPPVSVPVEQYVLENGLSVVLSEDHRVPLVALEVRYRVGAADERSGRSGFAHLFEHLMFQGSQHFAGEYFEAFEPIGAVVNAMTGQDYTTYFERVPSNYLERALFMESDRMFNLLPALSSRKLDNQRSVVRNERRQRYENVPYGEAGLRLTELLYPAGHPYHEPVVGSHDDLSAATLEDVKAFFAHHYVPDNAVLVLAGDFEPASAKTLVERYFAQPSGRNSRTATVTTIPRLEGVTYVTLRDRIDLPRIHLAWHTPALFGEEDAELDLWSTILAGDKTGRLHRDLVYDARVAAAVQAQQVSQRLSSFFVIEATAAAGRSLAELEHALFASLDKALATAPTPDEMQRARNEYEKSFFSRIESVILRASMLATYRQFVGTADYARGDLERYRRASPTSVHAAARRWLPLARYVRIDVVKEPASASHVGSSKEQPR